MPESPLSGQLVVAFTGRYHGLGNRVRVVLGARSLARFASRGFAYTWPTSKSFGARLDELWEFRERRLTVGTSRLLAIRFPYRREDLAWLGEAQADRVWQVRTAHALHLPEGAVPWGQELQALDPVADLAHRIVDFHDRHLAGDPYIGVMVRTHPISNVQTLEHSPLTWFLERMTQIRLERPGVRFFVSADTPQAQAEILGRIPDSFALSNKGAYNTRAALRSSVVDLYLLASSGHLVGPHYSSFPELAMHLAGPGLRMETSKTATGMRLTADSGLEAADSPLRPHIRRPA